MEKKTKKILLLSAGILLIGGGIGYWLWRRNQTPKEESNVPLSTDDSGTPSTSTGSTTTPTASGPSDVKAFQDWMDKNHPNWVKGKNLNKGSGYGSYGPSTQAAWNTYKTEFQNISRGTIGTTLPKPITTTGQTSSAIKVGDKVYARSFGKTYLYEYPASNSMVGNIQIGTYNQGCGKPGNVNVCSNVAIGTVLEVLANNWSKVRVNVKHLYDKGLSAGWRTSGDYYMYTTSLKK